MASYCAAEKITSWTCGRACNFHKGMTEIQVFTSPIQQAQGYCSFDTENNRIVVAFRGSSNIPNWIADFTFVPVPYSRCPDCMVHTGFVGYLKSISSGINGCVAKLAAKYPTADLFVTGHSLGAAVATLSVIELSEIVPASKITFMNFGSPRVGNQAFAEYFASTISNAFRVVNFKDLVPHVPPQHLGGI